MEKYIVVIEGHFSRIIIWIVFKGCSVWFGTSKKLPQKLSPQKTKHVAQTIGVKHNYNIVIIRGLEKN